MQEMVFWLWILIFVVLAVFAVYRRSAIYLMLAGLLLFAFSWVLTYDGVKDVVGVDKATGAFTYTTILPTNDYLFLIIAIGGFGVSLVLMFAGLAVMFYEIAREF